LLIIASGFWGCSKESSTTNNNNNTTDSIWYVVNTTNVANWNGYYLNENNQKVTVANQVNGWQVSFINKASKPRALELSATAAGINPTDSFTIETKIYANGNFVGFYFIKGTGNKAETSLSKATLN
ncbi:MAG: hypothetical protein JHD28_05570, partial [Bacteroidia bacterium]|nr:hypothetical protein [Bacteroidia bacterium]